jgi:uncharacterized membrane protein YkvA (DUF1232 family)
MADQDDHEELRSRVEKQAASVTEKDAKKVVDRERELEKKLLEVPAKLGKLLNQVKLLFELVRSYVNGSYRAVPWASIAMAVAALLYFLTPFDFIPDMIPGIGFIDDAFVVKFALTAIQSDLRAYCEAKGYDLSKYFD